MAADDFNVSGHALLSAKAAKLEGETELPAHVALAADLLGLDGLSLSGQAKQKAERALALQVSFQVEAGADAAVYSSRQVGDRTDDFQASSRAPFTGLDPRAEAIAARLTAVQNEEDDEDWGILPSLR